MCRQISQSATKFSVNVFLEVKLSWRLLIPECYLLRNCKMSIVDSNLIWTIFALDGFSLHRMYQRNLLAFYSRIFFLKTFSLVFNSQIKIPTNYEYLCNIRSNTKSKRRYILDFQLYKHVLRKSLFLDLQSLF